MARLEGGTGCLRFYLYFSHRCSTYTLLILRLILQLILFRQVQYTQLTFVHQPKRSHRKITIEHFQTQHNLTQLAQLFLHAETYPFSTRPSIYECSKTCIVYFCKGSQFWVADFMQSVLLQRFSILLSRQQQQMWLKRRKWASNDWHCHKEHHLLSRRKLKISLNLFSKLNFACISKKSWTNLWGVH